MSIKKSPFLAALLASTLISTAALAQTAASTAALATPQIKKPVPPVAPAVAPVTMPASVTPHAAADPAAKTTGNTGETGVIPTVAQYQKMRQEHNARFKPLSLAKQAHIAITHEHAARQRYNRDTHNLNDMTPHQRAVLKKELVAWFAALPLNRQVDLKKRDEILFGTDENYGQKAAKEKPAKKSHMSVIQISTTPTSGTKTETIIKAPTATPNIAPKITHTIPVKPLAVPPQPASAPAAQQPAAAPPALAPAH